nr:MAG TPA: hypothetical protein [Caudoviricetes sp.]
MPQAAHRAGKGVQGFITRPDAQMIFACNFKVLQNRRLAQFQLRIAVVGFVQPQELFDRKDLAVVFGWYCRHAITLKRIGRTLLYALLWCLRVNRFGHIRPEHTGLECRCADRIACRRSRLGRGIILDRSLGETRVGAVQRVLDRFAGASRQRDGMVGNRDCRLRANLTSRAGNIDAVCHRRHNERIVQEPALHERTAIALRVGVHFVLVQLHRGNRSVLEHQHEVHVGGHSCDLLDGNAVKFADNALAERLCCQRLNVVPLGRKLDELVILRIDVERAALRRNVVLVKRDVRVKHILDNRSLGRFRRKSNVQAGLFRPLVHAVIVDFRGHDLAHLTAQARACFLDAHLLLHVALVNDKGERTILFHREFVFHVGQILRNTVPVAVASAVVVNERHSAYLVESDRLYADKFAVKLLAERTLRVAVLKKSFQYLTGILVCKIDNSCHIDLLLVVAKEALQERVFAGFLLRRLQASQRFLFIAFVFGADRQLFVGLLELPLKLPPLIIAVGVYQQFPLADSRPDLLRDGLGVDVLELLLKSADIFALPRFRFAFARFLRCGFLQPTFCVLTQDPFVRYLRAKPLRNEHICADNVQKIRNVLSGCFRRRFQRLKNGCIFVAVLGKFLIFLL